MGGALVIKKKKKEIKVYINIKTHIKEDISRISIDSNHSNTLPLKVVYSLIFYFYDRLIKMLYYDRNKRILCVFQSTIFRIKIFFSYKFLCLLSI